MPILQSQCKSCVPSSNTGLCKKCNKTIEKDTCLCMQCFVNPHCCRRCGASLDRVRKITEERDALLKELEVREKKLEQTRAEVFSAHLELASLRNRPRHNDVNIPK